MIIESLFIVYVTCLANEKPSATIDTAPNVEKVIALTFDDGPRRGTTDRVLAELEKRKIKATFFIIGECIKGNEDLLAQMGKDGMEIGNHTFDHHRLTALSSDGINSELDRTERKIFEAANFKATIMRPPEGRHNTRVDEIVAAKNLTLIMWTLDPQDWRHRNSDYVTKYVLDNVQNYDIILLHDIHESTVLAVPRIIDGLTEKGYRFITVSELNAIKPPNASRKEPKAAAPHKRKSKKAK